MKENEISILKNKNKKLKKINIILITIIGLGLIGGSSGFLLYTHKRSFKNTVSYRMKQYKNTINKKYNENYEYTENIHNAAHKLKLLENGKDLQPTHPKILNFKEKWNGYKYWLIYSPYPYANDEYENPHMLVSNDLRKWEVPKGLKNPIEPKPNNYKKQKIYNSDPHILYNKDTNKIELYYRYVNDAKDEVIIYRKISSDGINWTNKEEILKNTRSIKDYVSPAFIYDNGTYKMWYVDRDLKVIYSESIDGYNYINERVINLNYPTDDLKSWHLDVIKTDKGYEMITVAYGDRAARFTMNLYYFKSADNIKYDKGIVILKPSLISWDNMGLYRSTFMYENNNYYLFYSAISNKGERAIGLSYGEHIENLIGSNI